MKYRRTIFLLLGFFSLISPCCASDVLIWGSSKEGVKIGIHIFAGGADYHLNGVVQIYIAKSPHYMTNLVLPPEPNQSFDFSLAGTNSQQVEKTAKGRDYGATLSTNMLHYARKRWRLGELADESIDVRQLSFFYIDDCFAIPEEGDYELEIKPRLLKEIGGDDVSRVFFDPIKVKLHLKANIHMK